MGSFNDYHGHKRENWTYPYKGQELLPFAEKKLTYFVRKETEARKALSRRLADTSLKANGQFNERLRSAIQTYANEREKVLVWVWQFGREPQKVFELGLADVTYFDIAGIPNNEEFEEDQG